MFNRKYIMSLISAMIINAIIATTLFQSLTLPVNPTSLTTVFISFLISGWGFNDIVNEYAIDGRFTQVRKSEI